MSMLSDEQKWDTWERVSDGLTLDAAERAARAEPVEVFTTDEWEGILSGRAMPDDMRVGESLAQYLARTYARQYATPAAPVVPEGVASMDRHFGFDLQFRRHGTTWPMQWRAATYMTKNEREYMRREGFGASPEEALRAMLAAHATNQEPTT